MRKLLLALLLACAPALATDQSEPSYIKLTPDECLELAVELSMAVGDRQSGAVTERKEPLSANAARVASIILERSPEIYAEEPIIILFSVAELCTAAEGETDVPEIVRN